MGILERKLREKEQRRSMIIDCAMEIFSEKGIGSTSMDEIAVRAEFSKATLYLYFRNKEELVIHAMLRVVSSFIELLQTKMAETEDETGKLHKVGEAYLEYYHKFPQYYKLLNSSEDIKDLDNPDCEVCRELKILTLQIWEVICAPIMVLIEKGIFKPDTNAVEMAMMLWAGSNGIINLWNHVDCTHQTEEMKKLEAGNPFLCQMNQVDYEQMLHHLWNCIVTSYLNQ